MFNIEIIATAFVDKGKFKEASITHKTDDGKVDNRRLVNFGEEKEVFKILTVSKRGDRFQITPQKILNEKDGKEYWRWVKADPFVAATESTGQVVPVSGKPAPRSTYETTEERAARQVYIVRQSSITAAINFLVAQNGGDVKKKFSAEEVLNLASTFETHVFKKDELPIVEVK